MSKLPGFPGPGIDFIQNLHEFAQQRGLSVFAKGDHSLILDQLADVLETHAIKIAIYWSRWKVWTLNTLDAFEQSGKRCHLPFTQAQMRNEMYLLGDKNLGTVPPLGLRLTFEDEIPKDAWKAGAVKAKIAEAQFLADNKVVINEEERRLGMFLLLYGRWTSCSQPANLGKMETLVSMDIQVDIDAESCSPDQGFQFVGSLSSMLTHRFQHLTTDRDKPTKLKPDTDPVNISDVLPDNYKGKILRLWQFTMLPSNQ